MSSINLGNQTVSISYKQDIDSREMNRKFLFQHGIYSGGTLAIKSGHIVNINPFETVLKLATKERIYVRTENLVELTISEVAPYITASYTWQDNEGVYLDFVAKDNGSLNPQDIIFGKGVYVAGVLTSFDYDEKTWGYFDDAGNYRADKSFLVNGSLDRRRDHLQVRNDTGSTILKHKVVEIAGHHSDIDIPKIKIVDAASDTPLGMVVDDIADGSSGYVIKYGIVQIVGFDTSGATIGDKVYATLVGDPTLVETTRPIGQVAALGTDGVILIDVAGVVHGVGTGTGTAFTIEINQTAHGLSVENFVRIDALGDYQKAIADIADNAEVVGVVIAVQDANNFTLQFGGEVDIFSGLTPGQAYFLSASTAGGYTSTPPDIGNQISKPVFIAHTTTNAFLFNMRGLEISPSTSSFYKLFTNADLTAGKIVINHKFNNRVVAVEVVNNNFDTVRPDRIRRIDADNVEIDLSSLSPISGTWYAMILDQGSTHGITETISLQNQVTYLRSRVDNADKKILELEIHDFYISRRQMFSSNFILDAFIDNRFISDFETATNKPAEIMDDNDWNNNWKYRTEAQLAGPEFKNGFMRPQKQPFMLEIIDQFELEGVGQVDKGQISSYDSTNDCHWLMTITSTGDGELLKISPNMKDGKVQVLSRWPFESAGGGLYMGGCESNGTHLFVVIAGLGTASKVLRYSINTDGTIGVGNRKPGEIINITTDQTHTHTSIQTSGYYQDLVIWDSSDIMVVNGTNVNAIDLISLKQSDLTIGVTPNQTGFEDILVSGGGDWNISIAKTGNILFMRRNDTSGNPKAIYRFDITTDIVSNVVIKCSGVFDLSRNLDFGGNAFEGIGISKEGDILEVTSTATVGKFISKRALKNAVWAENQVSGIKVCNATTNPNNAFACMVEGNRYLWSGDRGALAQEVDLFRYDTQTGDYWRVRLTGVTSAWTNILDLTTDGTTVWLLGFDGINYEVYFGSLSTLIASMSLNAETGTFNLDTFTLASGIGAANTDELLGIVYDTDNTILYLVNNTDDKIDTLSTDGSTWTQGVYDLPPPTTSNWIGIAYKNNKIFIRDLNNTASTLNKIYVLNLTLSNSTSWYRVHIYQDIGSLGTIGSTGIDFLNNDLVNYHYNDQRFNIMKILEDPNVMQLHSFMDSDNILLSNNVSCATPIVERYFDPEDFSDPRDVPDKQYCAIGYGDAGFSLLHLDEFLSDYSSTGQPRYDVIKIRVQNYKRGLNNLVEDASFDAASITIEKEIIFVGHRSLHKSILIDLKNSYTTNFYSSGSGETYQGTLSERNDGLAWTVANNTELALGSVNIRNVHARTFTKTDASDYKGELPITFILLSHAGGADLLVIDWDTNGNRTPIKIWNNLSSDSSAGRYAAWIAPSGYIFLGADDNLTGKVYYVIQKAWEIFSDGPLNTKEVGSNILTQRVRSFAPNSRCWKTASGEWRHQLFCGTHDASITTGFDYGAALVDVENESVEYILFFPTGTTDTDTAIKALDIFEDRVFVTVSPNITATELEGQLYFPLLKKYYKDLLVSELQNNWGTHSYQSIMSSTVRPRFQLLSNAIGVGGICRYSIDANILTIGSSVIGLQFSFFPHIDQCLSESTKQICNNPSSYNYVESALLPSGYSIDRIPVGDASLVYTNGGTANWTFDSLNNTASIFRDGVTEGSVLWTIPSGYDMLCIPFWVRPDGSDGVFTLTDITLSQPVTGWNGKTIGGYITGTAEINNVWISLDPTHTYTLKIEHSGTDYAGVNDLIMFSDPLLLKNMTSASLKKELILSHTSHAGYSKEIVLESDGSGDIELTDNIGTGDGVENQFAFSGTTRVGDIVQIGHGTSESTATWYYTYDLEVTFGSNSPDFNDEILDSDGYGTVTFSSPPPNADNIYLKYNPKADRFQIRHTMNHPSDSTNVDVKKNIRLLDYGLELY